MNVRALWGLMTLSVVFAVMFLAMQNYCWPARSPACFLLKPLDLNDGAEIVDGTEPLHRPAAA